MLDLIEIIPAVIAAITGGGWLISARKRRREDEEHQTKMTGMEAKITAALRDSETKYTREALEIYTQQVVEPMRQQLDRNTQAIARYQGAIDMAPTCRIYPDCVIIRKLRGTQNDHHGNPLRAKDVE